MIDQVEGREIPPSITEVHEKLINKEVKPLSTAASSSAMVPISANVANAKPKQYQGKQNQRNNQQYNNQRQDNRMTRGYQGRCQICGVHGHSAKRCSQLQQYQGSFNNNPMSIPFRPWQPRANLALGSATSTNPWLMDSGATHHRTSDFNNLSMYQPYNGEDVVLIGDGSGIPITHTGSLSLPSSLNSSRNLTLNNVLCVPNIHKFNLCLSPMQR